MLILMLMFQIFSILVIKMPYKRKSYTGRFVPLTAPNVKKPRNVSVGMRSTSTRLQQAMKSVEYKYLDKSKPATILSSLITAGMQDPATVLCLNGVSQGDTYESRDGRKYTITGCHIRGVFYRQNRNAQTEPGDSNFVTYALVLDTQTNKAQAASDSIFSSPGSSALCFQNLQNTQRFKVLHKATVDVPAGAPVYKGTVGAVDLGGSTVPFTIDRKLNITVNTSGTTGNVTDITDNSLHFVAFAHSSGATGSSIEMSYVSRVRFVG